MIRSKKKLNDLNSTFKRGDKSHIDEAIRLLREEQPFIGAIALLTSHYNNSDDTTIRKSIEEFMNDLKDQAAAKEIIEEIKKEWKPSTISMLVSSCWQSGLNYSEYAFDFINAFLKGDYVTAIECLTVIEEVSNDLTLKTKEEIIIIIRENPFPATDEKSTLTLELISILNS